jgi:hypothetical protein
MDDKKALLFSVDCENNTDLEKDTKFEDNKV